MSDFEALVESIVRMSPPVALMLGLNAMMYFARRTPRIPKWMVPWMTMITASVLYPLITNQSEMIFRVPYPVVAQAITGFLIGFAAVGSHRLFEQTVWRFGYDKASTSKDHDTEMLKKEDADKKSHKPTTRDDVGL